MFRSTLVSLGCEKMRVLPGNFGIEYPTKSPFDDAKSTGNSCRWNNYLRCVRYSEDIVSCHGLARSREDISLMAKRRWEVRLVNSI